MTPPHAPNATVVGATCSWCHGKGTYVGAPNDECERCEGTGREIPVVAARLDAQVRRERR